MKKLWLIGVIFITLVLFTSCMAPGYVTRSGASGKYNGRTIKSNNRYNNHGYNPGGHGRPSYRSSHGYHH